MDRQRLKKIVADICRGMALVLLGAALFSLYLSETQPTDAWLKSVTPVFLLIMTALNFVWSYLRPAEDGADLDDPAPKWSGVAVVLATGLTAAFAYSIGFTGHSTLLVAVGIVVVTLLAALAMWRFASSHEAEIGEARFFPGPAE